MTAMCSGPWRSSAKVVIATSAPTRRALTASPPEWTPDMAPSDTAGPRTGRRMAIQRSEEPPAVQGPTEPQLEVRATVMASDPVENAVEADEVEVMLHSDGNVLHDLRVGEEPLIGETATGRVALAPRRRGRGHLSDPRPRSSPTWAAQHGRASSATASPSTPSTTGQVRSG